MNDVKITLSAIWVATMLTYLLGDVLRIFAGDFTPGELDGMPVNGNMFLLAGIMMLIPILMVLLSIFLPHQAKFMIDQWVVGNMYSHGILPFRECEVSYRPV